MAGQAKRLLFQAHPPHTQVAAVAVFLQGGQLALAVLAAVGLGILGKYPAPQHPALPT